MSRSHFLATIAESLSRTPTAELTAAIEHALAVMGSTVDADRAELWLFDEATPTMVRTQNWSRTGHEDAASGPGPVSLDQAPALTATILAGEIVEIGDTSAPLPPFVELGTTMADLGVRSALLVPVQESGRSLGFITLAWRRGPGNWSLSDVRQVRTTALLFAQLVVRSRAEDRYGTAFTASPLGIALYGPKAELLEANPAFLEMHGATLQQMRDAELTSFSHPDDHERIAAAFMSLLAREVEQLEHVVRSRRLDGTEFYSQTSVSALWGPDGTPRLTVVISQDVTEERERTEAVQRSEERLRAVLDNAPVVFWRWDPEYRLTYVSTAVRSLFGHEPAEMEGLRLDQIVVEPAGAEDLRRILASVFETGVSVDTEMAVDTRLGSRILACRYAPERGADGEVTAVISITDDVTAARRSQVVLEQQARHDPLTGLANRQYLETELPRRIEDDEISALLYLDLDHFKVVNDSLGHSAGDELLRLVARRIAGAVRECDLITRLGGDEFVVLLGGGADSAGPWNIASRIRRAIAAPCWIGGQQVVVTASIGVARLSESTAGADLMLSRADRAMYHAKARGRDRTEELDEHPRQGEQTLLARRAELREALARSELELYYQPEVNMEDRSVTGAEALLRWHHPTQGLLSAAAFIGLAEDAGMMPDIGRFVIREAFTMARRFQTRPGRALTTRINLSAQQLDDDDLEFELDEALQVSGVRPDGICLEITETAVMRDAHVVLRRLHRLRERGFRLAIDDFGTGYSSLSYLKRFPIDVLKIDRSFVDGLGVDPHDTAIVTAIVQMASALGLEVVAEGVETEMQRTELLQLGCRAGQGYLFAHPMPAADFDDSAAPIPVDA